MANFGAQLKAWAEKTDRRLEDVDRDFKLRLFGKVIKATRVADPESWTPPYSPPPPSWIEKVATYKGGTMRGNWQVTTGGPALKFIEGRRNVGKMPASEAGKIQPFSETWLSNNTPYVRVYEEIDGMVGLTIADFRRLLAQAVNE